MAEIPTYNSRKVPSGSVARPNTPDYSVDIAQKLVRASNKVLDAKAIDEGFKQGKIEQAKALDEGGTLVEQQGYTLRSEAYNKGANAAYVAGMKSRAESELNAVATEINDPLSNIPIDDRLETYNQKVDEIRNDYMATIPSHLQGDLTNYFDNLNERYSSQVFANQRNLQVGEIKATISSRVDSALENLPMLIQDGGFQNNELLEEQFSDLVAAIDEGLGTISPATAEAYKEKLKTSIQYSALQHAYSQAEDKDAFIEDLENGGDGYKAIMAEVNETFFDGDENMNLLQGGEQGYKTLAKRLKLDLKNEKAEMAVDRAVWEQDATTALNLFKSGVNPGYVFDKEKMRELGFSESAILKYETSFRVAEEIYPELIEARGTAPNDNANLLKGLQSELFTLQNKTNLTQEDREDLVILQAQIDGISTIVANQRQAIEDGDINLLFDQAGIKYDTSTPEGIQKYHNQAISQFGLTVNNFKVVPQSQLDADAEKMVNGTFEDVIGLQQQYGKYFPDFIRDAGLVKNGYQTVATFMQTGNPAYAEQVFNAINDMESNIKTAKNIDTNFAGEGGALSEFNVAFSETYLPYLQGNIEMADDVKNAAQAIFVQTYIRTGDIEKAKASIDKNLNQSFELFDYNGMKTMLPKTMDIASITATIDEFVKHPQKFGIMTNSNFDITDFKEDFEDNTFDNYALAVDGNSLKIINKENAMGAATIVQRLPSASGELSYTNSIDLNNGADENVEHLESKDTVDSWEYDATVTQEVEVESVTADGDAQTETVNTSFVDIVDAKIDEAEATYQSNKVLYDEQQQELITNFGQGMYESYQRFDKNNDGNIMGEELAELRTYIEENQIEEPFAPTNFDHMEMMMLEYGKLDNPPVDHYVTTITSDRVLHPRLNAISMYVKSGQINEEIIEQLADIKAFEALQNDEIATEVMLNWKDNMNRTTNTKPPVRMTPIEALYDYVRDLEEANISATEAETLDNLIKTDPNSGVEYIPFG